MRWRRIHHEEAKDAIWISPEGKEMSEAHWHTGFSKTFGLMLDGSKLEWLSPEGEVVTDDSFLLLFNGHHEPIEFHLPKSARGDWDFVLTTATEVNDKTKRGHVEARGFSLFIRKQKA